MDSGDTDSHPLASSIVPLTKVESDSGMRQVVAMKDRAEACYFILSSLTGRPEWACTKLLLPTSVIA
jgi:hypothetical protein